MGGGIISLTVSGPLIINGELRVNGQDGHQGSSGGSGGSILISANSLEGNGLLFANGGAGTDYAAFTGGSGGGGRIAVHYNVSSFTGTTAAKGGQNTFSGGAGTIYWQNYTAPGYKSLYIANEPHVSNAAIRDEDIALIESTNGRVSWLTEPGENVFQFDEVIIAKGGALAINPTLISMDLPVSFWSLLRFL